MSKPKVHWDYDTCYEIAKECSYRSDLKHKCEQAYRTALKNGWINDYTWFVSKGEAITKNKTVYTKDMCYEEAKKYTSKIDFFRNSKGAYVAAKKNRWMLEYTWLIQPKQYKGKFNYGYCYEEAKKYKTRKEYKVGCSCGYHHARINKWLDDYTWFIHPEVSNKKWNKETCYNEAKKYKTLKEFADKSLGAYHVALKTNGYKIIYGLKEKKLILNGITIIAIMRLKNTKVEANLNKKTTQLIVVRIIMDGLMNSIGLSSQTKNGDIKLV